MWVVKARAAWRLCICRAWRALTCRSGIPSEEEHWPRRSSLATVALSVIGFLAFCLFLFGRRIAVADGDIPRSLRAGRVEVDAVFVTDCSDYQEWMTQVFLSRWIRAGPTQARLTRILSCAADDHRLQRILDRAAALRQHLEVYQLPELNGKGGDRYLCNNRPRGIRRWLQARPPRSRNHWIVMLDPDMLLLRPLDVLGTWRVSSDGEKFTDGMLSWRLADIPEGLAMSHHFQFVPRAWAQLNLSVEALCAVEDGATGGVESASSEGPALTPADIAAALRGCEGQLRPLFSDPDLVAQGYAIGVPHIIRATDLARMADAWEVMTDRVRAQYKGWTAEMYSWLLAARMAGIKFAYLAEAVSDPSAQEPAWDGIDSSDDETVADVCGAGEQVTVAPAQAAVPRGPWLVHYCEVYNVSYSSSSPSPNKAAGSEAVYLDKRMIAKALKATTWAKERGRRNQSATLLDCGAPLFEEPPQDLFARGPRAPTESGDVFRSLTDHAAAAQRRLFRRSAWMLCTTLRALNSGLAEARRRDCGVDEQVPASGEVDNRFGKTPEKLRAVPVAAQVADFFSKAGHRIPRARTIDWAERLNSTRARLADRRVTNGVK